MCETWTELALLIFLIVQPLTLFLALELFAWRYFARRRNSE